MPADGRCTLKEGDNELQVCMDKGGDDWEARSFQELGDEDKQQDGDDEIDEDDEIEMDVEPPPKVKNFKEAIEALEDVAKSFSREPWIHRGVKYGGISNR